MPKLAFSIPQVLVFLSSGFCDAFVHFTKFDNLMKSNLSSFEA
jgi:hypothetical protein